MKDIASIVVFGNSQCQVDVHPTPAHKCVSGQPLQTYQNYYKSEDGNLAAGIWSCEVGTFTVNFTEHEYIHILNGTIIIKDNNGQELRLTSGMHVVIPQGFQGTWQIVEAATKVFVNYELMSMGQAAEDRSV